MQAINASKPIVIGETASTELGGSKAAWIADLAATLPALFPNVRALVWFDANKEQDWRVDSSASSLAAWRSLIAGPAYQGRLHVPLPVCGPAASPRGRADPSAAYPRPRRAAMRAIGG